MCVCVCVLGLGTVDQIIDIDIATKSDWRDGVSYKYLYNVFFDK